MSAIPVLYKKSSDGTLLFWGVETDGNKITVKHGQLGGKIQSKDTFCEAKNIGKANETTPEQQALVEARAKWVKQKKQAYFETKAEALAHIDLNPMKAQNYNDYAKKVKYPAHISAKLDGLRCMVAKDGKCYSKSGEPYNLPAHIQREVDAVKQLLGDKFEGLDGEIYAGLGVLSLQQIVSAFRKPNENTDKLKFYIYDVPCGTQTYEERFNPVAQVVQGYNNVVLAPMSRVQSESVGDKWYENFVGLGFEGAVYRNLDALYEFGKRSYNLIKRKPRQTAEAKVISVREDKNGQGVLTVEAVNGAQKGKRFDLLMRKDADENVNYRLLENAIKLIEQVVEYQYEDLSDENIPLKPVGTRIRKVDQNGEAIE